MREIKHLLKSKKAAAVSCKAFIKASFRVKDIRCVILQLSYRSIKHFEFLTFKNRFENFSFERHRVKAVSKPFADELQDSQRHSGRLCASREFIDVDPATVLDLVRTRVQLLR